MMSFVAKHKVTKNDGMQGLCQIRDFREKSGKWVVLENITENARNSANARDNTGHIRENVCHCLFRLWIS